MFGNHLRWLCSAPALLEHPSCFALQRYLPADYRERISAIEQSSALRARFCALREQRLGVYFEALYACMLEYVLEWRILGRNIQIVDKNRTLGELDLVLHNRVDDCIEHHEIAVKFYLGHPQAGSPDADWVGPGRKDRLSRKVERLLGHQRQVRTHPATMAACAALDIEMPTTTKTLMMGYLFYPVSATVNAPDGVTAAHLKGDWVRGSELTDQGIDNTVVLQKPDWLGSWQQPSAPQAQASAAAVRAVVSGAAPVLLARLNQDSTSGHWSEQSRFFCVPDDWPQVKSSAAERKS